jgi:hypothetical protein
MCVSSTTALLDPTLPAGNTGERVTANSADTYLVNYAQSPSQ